MKFLCLDIPQPSATMEQYAPHMLDEARHGWDLIPLGPFTNWEMLFASGNA